MTGTAWRRSNAFLDEPSLAYKDIGPIMRDAADLVAIEGTLAAVVNVKDARLRHEIVGEPGHVVIEAWSPVTWLCY